MTMCGTPAYCAPEVLSKNRYSEKADIYSFGIVLWEIFARVTPHENKNPFEVASQVVNASLRPSLELAEFEHVPQRMLDLIQECWDAYPSKRPSFNEIVYVLECMLKDPHGEVPEYVGEEPPTPMSIGDPSSLDSDLISVTDTFINNII